MPYTDFHYTPTGTGVISGKEVLEQTEDAINDLGGQISGDVQTAIDTANNALNTANTASADAQNAVNTANTAYTAATNAQNTANTAQNTASNALTAAQNAQNDVNALGNRVTTAENNITQNTTDISGLTTRMGTAEGNITTLQNDVVTAQGTATSAQNTATMARQQAYVLRYSSTAITDNSTIAYSTLDNTDNIKVSDKIIDTDGKIFSVVSVDSDNSTVTVGTALIDLAQDSDVVHKSGNETVGGAKTFSENITCFSNSDAKSIICKTPLSTYDSTNIVGDNTKIRFLDKNNNSISYIMQRKLTNGNTDISLNVSNTDSNNQPIEASLNFVLDSANDPRLSPGIDNTISVGRPIFRYKSFYGMNYYYGSNNVEFSTKFVTTDTAQTISGNKTFSSINGVEPSSLSLPSDRSARIDISSYFTNTGTGDTNSYTVPANGYIYMEIADCINLYMYSQTTGNLTNYGNSICRNAIGKVVGILPVRKDDVFVSQWYTTTTVTVTNAYFIPCQGNI